MAKQEIGEYYADLDEDTGLYCVFHTETTKAYASFAGMKEAEQEAETMNKARQGRQG
jgi:hypothetical protein